MRMILALSVSFLLHTLLSGTAHAGIIINNLGQSVAGNSAVNGPLGGSETWTAVRFTTGAGDWQLNSLTARFADQSSLGSGLNPDGLRIEVRSEVGSIPDGGILGTLTSTSNITTEENYGFSASVPINLSGLTNYWLVARPTNSDSLYGWFVTASGADNGQSGWSLADDLLGTFDSGATWAGPFSSVPILSIDATLKSAAVPEPASFALIGFVLTGFAVRRRLRLPSGERPSKP